MAPNLILRHRTVYRYARPVQLGPQWIRLRPLPDPRMAPPGFVLRVEPVPMTQHWLEDALGNPTARITLAAPTETLAIEVHLDLDLAPRNPFDFVLAPECASWPFAYGGTESEALQQFTRAGPASPLLQAMRAETTEPQDTVSLLLALGDAVFRRIAYIVRMEPGVWTPEQTLAEGRGSCRDSAWLLVQLLRLHGIAARFVSGYLVQLAEFADDPGTATDSAELHAWAEAYLPGAGWIGIDATSGMLTAAGHISLAASPRPEDAAPLQGTVEPAEVRLDAFIVLERLPA